jgi:riboflavin synthase
VFTGLIQGLGTLQVLGEAQVKVTCEPQITAHLFADLELGDSVSVDGVCLTVNYGLSDGFVADVSPETLTRTTLGQATQVNLETSLRVGSKLGGHFVTGHVDGVGYLDSAVETINAWEMRFSASDPRVSRYIVSKGSIAVNGISLTVADCDPTGSWFTVAVIPVTYAETNLSQLQPGDPVNLEGDVLGKYVEKFLRLGHGTAPEPVEEFASYMQAEITPSFLADHGY